MVQNFFQVFEELIEEGLLFSVEDIILFLTVMGTLLFMATDLRIGLIIMFLLSAVEFVLFAIFGMETTKAMYALLITLVIMALSFYIGASKKYVV